MSQLFTFLLIAAITGGLMYVWVRCDIIEAQYEVDEDFD